MGGLDPGALQGEQLQKLNAFLRGERCSRNQPPTMMATIRPVQALTFTSYSLPFAETTSTDQTGGLSVFSRKGSEVF